MQQSSQRVCFFLLSATVVVATAIAQPQGTPRTQVAGTVTAVDPQSHHLSIKTDKGAAVSVSPTEKIVVIRIPAGETDVKKGVRVAVTDIAAGDRIVAIGAAARCRFHGGPFDPGDEQGGCRRNPTKGPAGLAEARHHRDGVGGGPAAPIRWRSKPGRRLSRWFRKRRRNTAGTPWIRPASRTASRAASVRFT